MCHLRLLLCFLVCSIWLSAASAPVNPFRQDEAFWKMLTPAARVVLADVQVTVRAECDTFVGGVYHSATNSIEICNIDLREQPDRLRHEALHALDWSNGRQATNSNRFVGATLANKLYARAEALYGGWFLEGELFAMVPIVVGWDFDQLPAEVAGFYAAWFEEAER